MVIEIQKNLETMENYAVIDYMGSWNIGAYIVLTNKFCIVGEGFRPQTLDIIRKITKIPLLMQRIYEEDLVGCFVAANSHGVVLPPQTLDVELMNVKRFLGDAVIVEKIELKNTPNNAFGNFILLNDMIAVIHDNLYRRNREAMNKIEDVLNVEVVPFKTSLTEALGSFALVNSRALVLSPLFNENEIEELRKLFNILPEKTIVSTVNMGSPIVRGGAVANDYALLVGNKTSGVELARMHNVLIR
ncbi:MAG: hypothetical protein QXH55_01410 [Candidatus Korarchaeota archaeon]|nr:hypothetical protein [Thermoproteota archaeon]MCR8470516.1 hypothetical protein [Thermoproteota archaeon]MCR8488724.1 hypothetical protein [Thermoproteota archaeon]